MYLTGNVEACLFYVNLYENDCGRKNRNEHPLSVCQVLQLTVLWQIAKYHFDETDS